MITLSLLIFGVIFSVNQNFGYTNLQKIFFFFSLQISFFALCCLLNQADISYFFWNRFLFSNSFTLYSKIFLFFFSTFITVLSVNYIKVNQIYFFEYWILFWLSLVSITFVIHSFDLLAIYISIELQSLIFYILTSINRTSEFSTEAGLKYFILGAFSSAFLLFGVSVIYALTGITNLNDFSKLFSGLVLERDFLSTSLILGVIFIFITILFKLNIAPFHFWSPDVYDGAPLSVTSIFAILPKIALVGLLIKFYYFAFFDFSFVTKFFIIFCCILSSVFGTLGAFLQSKWKRFIAFSAIGHGSFILLALITNNEYALNCIFFFLLIYSISSLSFFLIITNLNFFYFPNFNQSRFISDTKNLSLNNSILSLCLLITTFSLAGIPPLAGFFSKFFILSAAIKEKFFGLTIFVILMNCFSSFYYLRFSKVLYFDECQKHLVLRSVTKVTSYAIIICIFILVFTILDLEFFFVISKLMVSPFLS